MNKSGNFCTLEDLASICAFLYNWKTPFIDLKTLKTLSMEGAFAFVAVLTGTGKPI